MSLGLKNAPVTSQKPTNVILSTVRWQNALVYIEDIIIFSPTSEDHISHIESVLCLISEAGMTLKLKECHLFSDATDYLTHVITPDHLHVPAKTRHTIRELEYMTNTTEVRSVLDLCNVYLRLTSNFAREGLPLNKL